MNIFDMNCNCAYCKNDLPFDLPEEIIAATKNGNLILFAGSGISTENDLVFKETLYENVFTDLNLKTEIDFPSLMSKYCQRVNGRTQLLEKIHQRFEYCQQFHELYRIATKFHKEISSIYSIDKIVTTNWDNKNYQDLAYVEGYIIGMMSVLSDIPIKHFPFYYIIGIGPIVSYKKFTGLLKGNLVYHKTADKIGKKHFVKLLDKNSDVVPHHIAFIG